MAVLLAGFPVHVAGVTVNAKYQEMLDPGSQPATFVGNALSCAVGLTNIEIMTDPQDNLMGAHRRRNDTRQMRAARRGARSSAVRGEGFYLSMEIVRTRSPQPANGNAIMGIRAMLEGLRLVHAAAAATYSG
jgi:acetylornithine/succinyldiaminopimelate/putrescine aminotransferase